MSSEVSLQQACRARVKRPLAAFRSPWSGFFWASLLLVGSLVACGGSAPPRTAASTPPTATPTAQLDFGVDMARRGLWSEALVRVRQAERAIPGDAQVLNNLAVAYEALGRFDVALDHYRRARKSAPNDKAVRQNYSRFVEFYRAFKPDDSEAPTLGATPSPVQAASGGAS